MSVRRSGVLAAAALALAAGPTWALEPIRILSPAADEIVREQVTIKVPAEAVPVSAPTPGYVVVSIDGRFQAAVARPRTRKCWNAPAMCKLR